MGSGMDEAACPALYGMSRAMKESCVQTFDYVVIGAGPAGGAAALELARDARRYSVALIGDERYAPYERPPLSKATLREQGGCDAPQRLYGDLPDLRRAGVTPFIPDSVIEVCRTNRSLALASGGQLGYGALLFATGASPRQLLVPGATLPGVHYLRTYDDAIALAGKIRGRCKVAVIGGGFIGLEVAATARKMGCDVVVVEAGPRLLARAVPELISAAVLRKFEGEGVKVVFGEGVRAIHGEGRVGSIELTNGMRVDADCVLIGIGAVPNTTLAVSSGLDVGNGIIADSDGRTSDPYCFAAGDVANREQGLTTHPGYARRLEAWEPAIEQGVATAKVMLGTSLASITPPWVWSDQFDWNLQMAGHGDLADTHVVRRGANENAFSIFQLWQGQLIGVVTLNESRSMSLGRRALQRRVVLDPAQLADPAIPIKDALLGATALGRAPG